MHHKNRVRLRVSINPPPQNWGPPGGGDVVSPRTAGGSFEPSTLWGFHSEGRHLRSGRWWARRPSGGCGRSGPGRWSRATLPARCLDHRYPHPKPLHDHPKGLPDPPTKGSVIYGGYSKRLKIHNKKTLKKKCSGLLPDYSLSGGVI